jgi:transposase
VSATIKAVALELHLDGHAVKGLEMQYMRAQLAKAGTPRPKAIGIDEISIRKGHTCRIAVSDLIRRCPIWFGGEDRPEASMAQFHDWLGDKKSRGVRLAVMDTWKPFRNATLARAPQAAIRCPNCCARSSDGAGRGWGSCAASPRGCRPLRTPRPPRMPARA